MAQVRSVQPDPLPGPKAGYTSIGQVQPSATPSSEGFQLGGTMAAMGSQLLADQQKIAFEAKKQADTVAVMDAHNKLVLATQDMLYDPDKGAMSVQGKDALGLPDRVTDDFNRVAGELHGSLSNPEQQSAFSRLATNDYESTIGKVKEHSFSEYQKYSNETFVANQKILVDTARINARSPQDVADVLGQVEGSTTAYGRAHGWSQDKITESIDRTSSDVHAVVVEQLIASGNIAEAQQYLKKHGDGIQDPKTQKSLGEQLEIGNVRVQSAQNATQILSGLTAESTLQDAMTEVDKLPESSDTQVQVKDATRERVKAQMSAFRQSQADAAAARNASAKEIIDQHQIEAVNIVESTHAIDKIPPAIWSTFSESQRSALRSYARTLSEGKKVETDFGVFQSLVSMASLPATQQDFAKIDLNSPKYLNSISKEDLNHLLDLKASILKGTADKTDALLNDYRSAETIINDTLFPLTRDLSPKDAESLKVQIHQQVAQYQVKQQLKTGKPASDDDLQSFVDGLIINGSSLSPVWGLGLFGGNPIDKAAYTLKPGETLDVGGVKLTQDQIVGITQALRTEGAPVTPANIAARAKARGIQ